MSEQLDRWSVSAVFGITEQGADQIAKRAKPRPQIEGWFDHVLPIRPNHLALLQPPSPNESTRRSHQLTVQEVAGVFGLAKTTLSADRAGFAVGALQVDVDILREEWSLFLQRAGRRFWPEQGANASRRQARAIRELTSLQELGKFWRWIDEAPEGPRAKRIVAVANALFALLKPTHEKDIYLPRLEAEFLVQLLKDAGIEPELIEREIDGATEIIRVLRPSKPESKRYAGLAIKRTLGIVYIAARYQLRASLDKS
jgi:hypothetical protein